MYTHTRIDFRQILWDCLLQLHYVLVVMSGHSQYDELAISLCIVSSQFSLTSLFYGEPSEKEKSPSESSLSDSETKDMVSFD